MKNLIDPTPAWLIRRYKKLWEEYGTEKFSFEEAVKILNEDSKFVSVVLSELKKAEWLNVELDPTDSRKRLYQLKPLKEVMSQFVTSAFGDVAKNIKVSA